MNVFEKIIERIEEKAFSIQIKQGIKEPSTFDAMMEKFSVLEIKEIINQVEKDNINERNADNIDKAIEGLSQFTKNWCMNCEETEKQNDLVFRCKQCEFSGELGICQIKKFVIDNTGDMPTDFGAMCH